jgi:hypothetical protein
MAIPIKVSCSGVAHLDGLLDPQPSNQADSKAREIPGTGRIAALPGFVVFRGGEAIKRASEGSGMHIDPNECHPAMDYTEHQKTYKLFTKLTLVTIVAVVVLMAFLYIFVV